jgi:hypothetical protein
LKFAVVSLNMHTRAAAAMNVPCLSPCCTHNKPRFYTAEVAIAGGWCNGRAGPSDTSGWAGQAAGCTGLTKKLCLTTTAACLPSFALDHGWCIWYMWYGDLPSRIGRKANDSKLSKDILYRHDDARHQRTTVVIIAIYFLSHFSISALSFPLLLFQDLQ